MKTLPPLRIAVQAGDVVRVAVADLRYCARPVTLRVKRIRYELARYYDNEWIWLEGHPLYPDGTAGDCRQVLVRVAALPASGAR